MIRPLATLLLATSALVPISVQAQEPPSAGRVAAGSASHATSTPGAMTITQGSNRAIINWQSFSIGEGGRVDIFQSDAGSVLLNRVTGNTGSRIAEALNANGQVYLVNANGILITGPDIALTGAAIDVSGASGGGMVKIGGDYMGGGILPRAQTLTVDATSHIRADATGAGAGKGGDAEVSSKGRLGYTGHAHCAARRSAR